MIRQIRYFQAVVGCGSFSEAAEQCHVSQSAISQGVQALERELGFDLLERRNRRFTLTPAGEHFYHKSLILMADYERICSESARIAQGPRSVLTIGYLRAYAGPEFQLALEEFSSACPGVQLTIIPGNHEELYELLRTDQADLVLSDQRRAFSDEYCNHILSTCSEYAAVAPRIPIAALPSVSPGDLKNTPCILVTSSSQQETERDYFHHVIGIQSDFLYAENLEKARLMVVSGQGFMLPEGIRDPCSADSGTALIPLVRSQTPIRRNYCTFWKRSSTNPSIQQFFAVLQSKFGSDQLPG
ncbi:MAG: LysR family transcriptional regulator [Clostridia bacterium]|nr:LysR family transcriptional regulator [Clostridia bacterium]